MKNLSAVKGDSEGWDFIVQMVCCAEEPGGFLSKVTGTYWGTEPPHFFNNKSKILNKHTSFI